MLDISPDIRTRFNALLVKRAIPEKYYYEYRKWLRYYLDFCRKYYFQELQQESLLHFIKKLQGKNQTQEQQKQASHAVSLYYELVKSGSEKEMTSAQPLMSQRLTEENKKVTLTPHQGRGNNVSAPLERRTHPLIPS